MITGIVILGNGSGKEIFRQNFDLDRIDVEKKLVSFVRDIGTGWFVLDTKDENDNLLSTETVEVYPEDGETLVERHNYDCTDDYPEA